MNMKTVTLFLLLASLRCCFGQTDTNILATGGWSEAVTDSGGHTLRGRLLVYDDQGPGAANHARIYLELQQVFQGVWQTPLEIHFDIAKDDLHVELRDEHDRPVPQERPVPIIGPAPPGNPCWVTLPCDSTVRLRADTYCYGPQTKPDGLEIFVNYQTWILRSNATNDYFLSGSFTPSKDHPSPLNYHIWQGTLKLPKMKIPYKKT